MIKHFVLFNVPTGLPDSEFHEIRHAARSLPGSIPEIQDFHFGQTFDAVMPPTWMYCMSMSFEDVTALNRYVHHPTHTAFIDLLRGCITDRVTHTVDDSPSIEDLIGGAPR